MRVTISPMARIYGTLKTGTNCRIDDFVIITGEVVLGNHVHIGCFCFLSGGEGIEMGDYSTLSARGSIFTRSDDYGGESLTNPTIPDKFKPGLDHRPVEIGRHVVIGAHTVILPGVVIGDGASVGAQSLVSKDLDPWGVYAGVPAKKLRDRSRKLLRLEQEFTIYDRGGIV